MRTLLAMGANQSSALVFPIPAERIRPHLAAPVSMTRQAPADTPLPMHAAAPVTGAGAAPVRISRDAEGARPFGAAEKPQARSRGIRR